MASFLRILYFAPGDIQIARVDRQAIVYFCEALHRLGFGVELVAMGIKLLDGETKAADPLDLYRLRERFPVRIVKTPVRQVSGDFWWAANRLWVHLTSAGRTLRLPRGAEQLVLYTKNYSSALGLMLMLKLARSKPLVLFEAHLPPRNRIQKHVLEKVDGVIANTYALGRDLVGRHGLPATKVLGTHQGVDLELMNQLRLSKREARLKLGLSVEKKLIVYTGKVYYGYKEIEYLLEAAPLLPSDCELVIVGGRADHVTRIRNFILRERISNVRVVGFVPPSCVQYYQFASDVLLLYYPSGLVLNEYRSPGKLFEYMASGRPIVAVDLPILREVLGDQPAAVLVPPDSPQSLALAIRALLADERRAATLAARALELACKFTWGARALAIVNFIKSISNSSLGLVNHLNEVSHTDQ